MNNRKLTDKEFRDIVTPFVKAYKKKKSGELGLHEEMEINGKSIGVDVVKFEDEFAIFGDAYVIDKNIDDSEWKHFNSFDHTIESNGNTTIEIVDFLSYEYGREMTKI